MKSTDLLEASVNSRSVAALGLLGGFRVVWQGCDLALPATPQRVLAVLAIAAQPVDRLMLAATIWQHGNDSRRTASLRTALWRIRRACPLPLVESTGNHVRLSAIVRVDLHHAANQARRLCDPTERSPIDDPCEALLGELCRELLPFWPDEWLTLERGRWNQLRLHALEQLSEHLMLTGRYEAALQCAMTAVAIEPYRESAHRALIKVHLAEGNAANALAQYHQYRRLLLRDLGAQPTPRIAVLVESLSTDQ
jgi:DNA-binding SARP family transcriptional activator